MCCCGLIFTFNAQYHTAKVTSIAWTPDSKHIATGSLDTNIMVRYSVIVIVIVVVVLFSFVSALTAVLIAAIDLGR